jgi:uncharacterized membrane protein YpjA
MQMQDASISKGKHFATSVGVVIFAAILGALSGLLMSLIAPSDKYSWAGLAIVPIWLLLEFYFEGISDSFGQYGRVARIVSTIALMASFYVVFLGFRGLAS